MKAYFDTNVIVAGSVKGHIHYRRAVEALIPVYRHEVAGAISVQGLSEVYSVLTRAPFVPRIYPAEAWKTISSMVLAHFELVELTAQDYGETLERCVSHGWAGAKVHDALHIHAARKSECNRLYTFDVQDFRRLAGEQSDMITMP